MLQIALLVIALFCFIGAALGAAVPRVALVPLGLACWCGALLMHVLGRG